MDRSLAGLLAAGKITREVAYDNVSNIPDFEEYLRRAGENYQGLDALDPMSLQPGYETGASRKLS